MPGKLAAPDAIVLLTLADAVRHHRPVSIRYTAADGRRSERTLHPYGLVSHSGRWYITGADAETGEERTFRLDRIADARALPGSFEPPPGLDPAQRVLSGFATATYRHHVILRVQGTTGQIRARLPASVATIEEPSPAERPPGSEPPLAAGSQASRWHRVEVRAERLDWLPPVLASLDLPFAIEQPDELRELVIALADRLRASATTR
jgi:predicted DNA-binding transcriptional regulator YafY